MKTRLIAVALIAIMAMTFIAPAFADIIIMYAKTDNGKALNVRAKDSKSAKVVGKIPYGGEVQTITEHANHWMEIMYNGKTAYVQSRYLSETKPPKRKTPVAPEKSDREKKLEEMNKQLKTLKTISEPFFISVRPSRPSGWVNFRVGPGEAASRICTYTADKQLQAIGETTKWYQAIDPQTNTVGFISKNFVTVLPREVAAASSAAGLGTLNVNGEFQLQCRMPEGYSLQVSNMQGSRIIASLNPLTAMKPVLYLSIAHSELYSDVERLNDLGEEDLAMLEQSFREMNDVDISYGMTDHGTKLLVAREIGTDTDFVDIVTLYKGYSIEFVMTPNQAAADKTLTDAQTKMCIDFLSDLDFIPVA